MVNLSRKTLWNSNKSKEDPAKTKRDATWEAVANNSAAPLVNCYCFIKGNWFRGVGDTVCFPDVLLALEAGREVTESALLLRVVDAIFRFSATQCSRVTTVCGAVARS